MPAVVISYKISDAEGHQTSMPIHYDAADVNTLAKAQSIVDEFAVLYADIAKCEIVGADVSFPLTVPVDAAGAENDYTNDRGVTLSFYTEDGVSHSIFVPGWDLAKISAGKVDESAGDVMDFINALASGAGITGGYQASDAGGRDLSGYRRGKQTTRKIKH